MRDRIVPVVDVRGTLRLDGRLDGGYEVRVAEVSPDDACDLADHLWGGPLIYLAPFKVESWLWRERLLYGWTVRIMARTPRDAFHAVHDLEWLVEWGCAFPEDQVPADTPVTCRLRYGELADIEADYSSSSSV